MLIAARGPFRVLVLLTRARYLPDYDTCMLHYVVGIPTWVTVLDTNPVRSPSWCHKPLTSSATVCRLPMECSFLSIGSSPLKFLPYHTTKTRKEKQPFIMKTPNLPSQACYAPTPPASSIAVYRKYTTSPYSAYEHFPLAKPYANSSIMTKHPDAAFQVRRTQLHSQKYRCTAWRSFFFLLRYNVR